MQAVDRALDVALLVMQSGGTTVMANRAFRDVLKGFKQEGVTAAWRLDLVAASCLTAGQYDTVVRPVGTIGVNLVRAAEAVALGDRVARGEVSTAEIAAEVQRIKGLASPYGRWVLTAAAACAAAFFSQIPGGDWGAFGIAFLAAGVGQYVRLRLQSLKLAVAPVTLACGVLSACIAGLGLRLELSQTVPATLIASVIYMVPGLPLINGFVDLASHRYLLAGVERIANATFLFLVLAIALAIAYAVVM